MPKSSGILKTRNTIAGIALAAAFLISICGDWFFENQWTNPNWYLFEFIVWSAGFGLFFCLFKSDNKPDEEREDSRNTNIDVKK